MCQSHGACATPRRKKTRQNKAESERARERERERERGPPAPTPLAKETLGLKSYCTLCFLLRVPIYFTGRCPARASQVKAGQRHVCNAGNLGMLSRIVDLSPSVLEHPWYRGMRHAAEIYPGSRPSFIWNFVRRNNANRSKWSLLFKPTGEDGGLNVLDSFFDKQGRKARRDSRTLVARVRDFPALMLESGQASLIRRTGRDAHQNEVKPMFASSRLRTWLRKIALPSQTEEQCRHSHHQPKCYEALPAAPADKAEPSAADLD